jgi:hypothetical protein
MAQLFIGAYATGNNDTTYQKSDNFQRNSFPGYGKLPAIFFLPDYRLKRHSPGGEIHGQDFLITCFFLTVSLHQSHFYSPKPGIIFKTAPC